MKALSLTQPWASLCVLLNSVGDAAKQFETRGWKPSDKMMKAIGDNPIAIHAAQGFPKEAMYFARTNPFVKAALNPNWFNITDQLPLGAIIGTVELYRFIPTESARNAISERELNFGDYSNNRWAWQLLNPVMLKTPIPCKGALSLWEVPKEVEEKILLSMI